MRFDGKVELVTGGTQGIGEGCVRVFAAAGAKVVFCARGEAAGKKLAKELGADFVRADVSKAAEVEAFVEARRRGTGGSIA